MKPLLQRCDVRLGRWLTIHHTAYTSERVTAGTGPYTVDDWTRARQSELGDAIGTPADADAAFFSRALGVERRKLDSGLRLADWIERTGVRSVLELGCGEMITAWTIKTRLPALRYMATDFDPFVIERARRVPALAGVEKSVLDVHEVSAEMLGAFDLVAAWDVFYAFSTERLDRFLARVKAGGAVFMLCTSQLVGPLRGLSYAYRSRVAGYDRRSRLGEIRAHGFKSSLRYYREAAGRCGLSCRVAGAPHWSSPSGDCYVFLRFCRGDR